MISTEWGNVWALKDGFNPADVANGNYGTHLNVFDWKERKLIQRIDVGIEGVMPLEIRYCVVCVLGLPKMFGVLFLKLQTGDWPKPWRCTMFQFPPEMFDHVRRAPKTTD